MVNKELPSLFVLAHFGKVVQQLDWFPKRNGLYNYGCLLEVLSSNLAALLIKTAQKAIGLCHRDFPFYLRKCGDHPHL